MITLAAWLRKKFSRCVRPSKRRLGVETLEDRTVPTMVSGTGGFVLTPVEFQAFTGKTVATFTDPGGPGPSSAYLASINWGDGSSSAGTVSAPSGGVFTVTGGHTYSQASTAALPGSNPFQISVTISRAIGIVADDQNHSIDVFDANSHTVLGTLSLPGSGLAQNGTGGGALNANGSLGFVTDFTNHVYVVNLTNPSAPTLANTITISNPGEGLSITPDGKFLLVSGGSGGTNPIVVVNIATQTQVGTLQVGSDEDAVDAASGSILATSLADQTVRRLTINSVGTLTDTGNSLGVSFFPTNVVSAPGGQTGVVIGATVDSLNNETDAIESFTVAGLTAVDTRTTSDPSQAASAVFNSTGTVLYVQNTSGVVNAFGFNAATGHLSVSPLFTISNEPTFGYSSVNTLTLSPDGTELYVSNYINGSIDVFNAATGASITSITDSGIITNPTGIAIQAPPTTVIDTATVTAAPLPVRSSGGNSTITLPAGTTDAVLRDSGTSGQETLSSASGFFAPTTFTDPTGTLTINGTSGAAEKLTIQALNPSFNPSSTLAG